MRGKGIDEGGTTGTNATLKAGPRVGAKVAAELPAFEEPGAATLPPAPHQDRTALVVAAPEVHWDVDGAAVDLHTRQLVRVE